jgi:hypothetical protein
LTRAAAGSSGQWAFGAGAKAVTWVTQQDRDTWLELGLSYFSATKSKGLTPGHATPDDARYRTFDPDATVLNCFRCHSTGPLALGANHSIEPSEPGIHCEACHGPGGEHIKSTGGTGTIFNPKRLSAAGLNDFCGTCHRNAPESDWTDKWKTRHQPSYLSQAACFRKSDGKLTCLTCHDPHSPLNETAADYDRRCSECHKAVRHRTAVAARSCVDCHMPQVTISAQLRFTNHWIGIYTKGGANLVPAYSVAKDMPPPLRDNGLSTLPHAPSLRPLFEQALAERERELPANDPRIARSAADLGLFLSKAGDRSAAETQLRRALEIDRRNGASQTGEDAENLG